jgi:hypothetical protein
VATLNFLHGYGARVLVIYAVLLALWGTFLYFSNRPVSGGFRSTYLIMAGLTAVQGLLGLGTLLMGARPHELLHIVYGVFAVLFLPGAYLYAHGGSARRETLVLAGAAWIVAIAYFRGMATG